MTDKRIKEPCPICKTPATEIQIVPVTKCMNKIKCPKCGLTFDWLGGKAETYRRMEL